MNEVFYITLIAITILVYFWAIYKLNQENFHLLNVELNALNSDIVSLTESNENLSLQLFEANSTIANNKNTILNLRRNERKLRCILKKSTGDKQYEPTENKLLPPRTKTKSRKK